MRVSRLFSSAAALAFVQAVLASDVLDLTNTNFDSLVKPEALMLVEFFAPWCVCRMNGRDFGPYVYS